MTSETNKTHGLIIAMLTLQGLLGKPVDPNAPRRRERDGRTPEQVAFRKTRAQAKRDRKQAKIAKRRS